MKKLFLSIFIFIFLGSLSFSQTSTNVPVSSVSDFNGSNVSVVNNNFNYLQNSLNTANSTITSLQSQIATDIPSGIIVMWHGSIASIPSGWVLCNGSNGTPDLRNQFIVGANADVSGNAESTISGSAAQSGGSTTITQANIPNYNITVPTTTSSWNSSPDGSQFPGGVGSNTAATINSGGSGTAYVQPYYALAFIMKS